MPFQILDKFIIHYLGRFDKHCFQVRLHDKTYTIGTGDPEFCVIVHKDISKKALIDSPQLALGEAYMRGDIEIQGDLFHMLCCFLEQSEQFSGGGSALREILYMSEKKNDQARFVASHYDLGNDFYKLWLDPTMSYSCAYFKHPNDTLEQAQRNKVDYTLKKLHLEKGMRLLDIGCGWVFLLIEAAKKYGIKGFGCTLSKEQYTEAQRRIAEAGLSDSIDVELVDYRDLEERHMKFDRVVSIGMMEHVGRSNYGIYMGTAARLLNDGGMFLLHTITGYDEQASDPWLHKYIFPGGMAPCLHEIIQEAYKQNFRILDVESLRRHYYHTLMYWYKNFSAVHEKVRAARGEEFVRMWDLYLCGCAAAFFTGHIDVHQTLMTKGTNNDLPMTRWY